MNNGFITKEFIARYGGCVATTSLIIQCTKNIPCIKKIPTKYYAFIISLINVIFGSIITNMKFSMENVYIVIVNAMLVTLTSTGGYDYPRNNKKKIEELLNENMSNANDKENLSNDLNNNVNYNDVKYNDYNNNYPVG